MIPGMPNTCVPIAPVTSYCDKRCCKATQVPLRVAKACTIHKAQGGSVGEGQPWTHLCVDLPRNRKCPCLELVAFSRATELCRLAIFDDQEITYRQVLEIGRGPAYEKKQAFEQELKELSQQTMAPFIEEIKAFDTSGDINTFDGGFASLVEWYRNYVSDIRVST